MLDRQKSDLRAVDRQKSDLRAVDRQKSDLRAVDPYSMTKFHVVFLVIFMALFLTFLILYIVEVTNQTNIPNTAMSKSLKLLVPKEASNGTNKKSSQALKFAPLDNLAQLESVALSNFSLSRLDYAYETFQKKPFLTIVTRTCVTRKILLQRNIEMCAKMFNKDFEHVILSDQRMSGMLIAETALYAFRHEFKGDYICHLDDDDYLCNFSLVDIIKTISTQVIIAKAWSVDQQRLLPCVWQKFPLEGEICTSNVIVRRDLYLANIETIAKDHAGDYTFIHNVLVDAREDMMWVDMVFFYISKDAKRTAPKATQYVTVELQGGLGNQLFQVATAYAYAREHDKTLIFDHQQTIVSPNATVPRPAYFKSLFQWTEDANAINQKYWNDYSEPSFEYHAIPYFHGNVRLKGYFQSDQYFRKYRSDFTRLILSSTKTLLETTTGCQILNSTATTSLHIRRGDYVNNALHTNQNLDYYTKAVDHITQAVGKLQLLIFSDDPQWCRENLVQLWPNHDLQFVSGTSDEADLVQMSQCRHHILANSSFSWWGTYLSQTSEASMVVAPKVWFNDSKVNWQDIYCQGWIMM